jgi:DNA-directed RNA polymerase subunit RPC12/RpoP
MPRIICLTCGREVYATARVEQLFTDERRCPRCGASLENDRRATDRRIKERRENPPGDPGPPDGEERRTKERRGGRRRRDDGGGSLDPRRRGWIE